MRDLIALAFAGLLIFAGWNRSFSSYFVANQAPVLVATPTPRTTPQPISKLDEAAKPVVRHAK